MSKRLMLAILLMPIAFLGFAAQLTATLQSGDNVTPFYGQNAFVDAYNAAIDGDIITLSPGEFATTEIKKSVTVIGAFAFANNSATSTIMQSLTISGDNITIEGIRFGSLMIQGTENLNVNRCHMEILNAHGNYIHNNTIISDCLINQYNAMPSSKNTIIQNSCVNYFSGTNSSSNIALIENCNIPLFAYCNQNTINSYNCPYAIYRNCVLGFYSHNYYRNGKDPYEPSLQLSSPSEFHNNTFIYSYYLKSDNKGCKPWNIVWGSCVLSGNNSVSYYEVTNRSDVDRLNSFTCRGNNGPQNHKEYPSTPIIISSSIDTKTDSDGVLHVKITATTRD